LISNYWLKPPYQSLKPLQQRKIPKIPKILKHILKFLTNHGTHLTVDRLGKGEEANQNTASQLQVEWYKWARSTSFFKNIAKARTKCFVTYLELVARNNIYKEIENVTPVYGSGNIVSL
jgi:hypothetical protein